MSFVLGWVCVELFSCDRYVITECSGRVEVMRIRAEKQEGRAWMELNLRLEV